MLHHLAGLTYICTVLLLHATPPGWPSRCPGTVLLLCVTPPGWPYLYSPVALCYTTWLALPVFAQSCCSVLHHLAGLTCTCTVLLLRVTPPGWPYLYLHSPVAPCYTPCWPYLYLYSPVAPCYTTWLALPVLAQSCCSVLHHLAGLTCTCTVLLLRVTPPCWPSSRASRLERGRLGFEGGCLCSKARTGWPGVSILLVSEITRLFWSFFLGAAACTLQGTQWIRLWDAQACYFGIKQATNNCFMLHYTENWTIHVTKPSLKTLHISSLGLPNKRCSGMS